MNAISKTRADLTLLRSSPTAYNVFTAYAIITQSVNAAGICVTETGSTTSIPTGYSEIIDDSSGVVTLGAVGEQKFVTDVLSISTCQVSAANVVPSALLQVTALTPVTTLFYNTVSRVFASLSIAPVSLYIKYECLDTSLKSVAFFLDHPVMWVEVCALESLPFRTSTPRSAGSTSPPLLLSLSHVNFLHPRILFSRVQS